MPILLELYQCWTIGGQRIALVCPACGLPFERGQAVASFVNRWSRNCYVVHEACEVTLHTLLTTEANNERDILIAS